MAYPTVTIFILRHNLSVQETGTEMECLRYLQHAQPNSAIWAMRVDNWALEERTFDQKDYPRQCSCCKLPMEAGYIFDAAHYACELDACRDHILRKFYDGKKWHELHAEANDAFYYTEWDMSCVNDGDEYWYVKDGKVWEATL